MSKHPSGMVDSYVVLLKRFFIVSIDGAVNV